MVHEELCGKVMKLVEGETKITFPKRQLPGIRGHLAKRMSDLEIETPDQYWDYVNANLKAEMPILISLLTIHHTFFFREFSQFEFMLDHVLPKLIAEMNRSNEKFIRIWSAASSRGQEAYSLAMFLRVHLPTIAPGFDFEIEGTDIDAESVEIAVNGVYKASDVKEVPIHYSQGCFAHGKGDLAEWVKAKKVIASKCRFEVLNLLNLTSGRTQKTPQKPYHLILCKNVMIYFTLDQMKETIPKLLERLHPSGVFFIGLSESLQNIDLPLIPLGNGAFTHSTSQVKVEPEQKNSSHTLVRVLAVDDDEDVLALLKKTLAGNATVKIVATASSCSEAMAVLSKQAIDLILLDLFMPKQNGLEFLRMNQGRSLPPVIILSSVSAADVSVAKQCLKLGAADYIEKGTDRAMKETCEEIVNKIRSALRVRMAAPRVETPKSLPLRKSLPPVPPKSMHHVNELEFDLKLGVLLTLHDSVNRAGVGRIFKGIVNTAVAERNISEMISTLSADAVLEAKVVGTQYQVNFIENLIRARKLEIKTLKVLESIELKAVFEPASGRLRLRSSKIAVAIVDDSKVIRELLKKIFARDPEIEVVAEFASSVEAAKRLAEINPDVITLDINMPEMDGVALFEQHIAKTHIPTIVITSLNKMDGTSVLRVLESGAVDYVQKPSFEELGEMGPLLIEKIKIASRTRIKAQTAPSTLPRENLGTRLDLLVIGASTGGVEAVTKILLRLTKNVPPILIAQHIPPVFSAAYAARLNTLCEFEVKEAVDGDNVLPGRALLAPGGLQTELVASRDGKWSVRVKEGAAVNRHRPSVDVLFNSVASVVGSKACGVLLTGMGKDGAQGLLEMKNRGAVTLAQDEESSVVWGMPKAAIEIGGASHVVALDEVAAKLKEIFNEKSKRVA